MHSHCILTAVHLLLKAPASRLALQLSHLREIVNLTHGPGSQEGSNRILPCPALELPQDAHEFFCGLLDVLQGEVLAVEAGRLGRQLIRISETADPAARSFSFAVSQCASWRLGVVGRGLQGVLQAAT